MISITESKNKSLISIVIPCYNAELWIREAVNSCLQQAYYPIEIIVVDDGSTDDSLNILRTYGDNIILETGPNYGGNHARNRGFALSKGSYIQFLDADDYILSDKLTHQVTFLEKTKADVVYGDWRHQFHEPDNRLYLGDLVSSGEQHDVLESLLAGWWVAPVALLFRRESVIATSGWDESLQAGQDRDFFISIAMTGADIRYQPGCHSIYRRWGNTTVSTSNRLRWLENHLSVLEKAEARLLASGNLTPRYQCALAKSYFHLARNYYPIDRTTCKKLFIKTLSLDKNFMAGELNFYNAVARLVGYMNAEWLAGIKRKMFNNISTT